MSFMQNIPSDGSSSEVKSLRILILFALSRNEHFQQDLTS
jgi:hypothetical protein